MKPQLALSSEARDHLAAELEGRWLRIAFTTGCGGSGYRLSTAGAPGEGDVELEIDGIPVALDSMAARTLDGATILYDPEEDGYGLDHPSAVTTAWCG